MQEIKGNLPNHKILVEEIKLSDHKTDSGLIIPGEYREPQSTAKVVKLPKIRKGDDLLQSIHVGDLVHYRKNAGSKLLINGNNYVLISSSDVYFFEETDDTVYEYIDNKEVFKTGEPVETHIDNGKESEEG